MTDTVMMLVCARTHTHDADSEAADCHSKVRITSSPRFTKLSSIKCVVITSGLCCSVASNLNDF